ncbi:MAG TPA: hypothetical protein DCP90_07260, partial [Clostridiales bacterium]|nr:hypothetical protein [Clostridiales bacterium]
MKWYAVILLLPVGWYILVENFKFTRSKYKLEAVATLFGTLFDIGKYGEYLTFVELEKLEGTYKIVANTYVPKDNGEDSEIDLVLIHEKGIFVIESKNYSGWIYGSDAQEKWTATYNKYAKTQFYNPVWQNATHIKWLEKCLEIGSDSVYSLIVFSERCNLKKLKVTKTNTLALKRENLLGTLKAIIGKNQTIYDKNQIDKMYYALKRCTYKTEEEKQQHIDDVKLHTASHGKIITTSQASKELSEKVEKVEPSYIALAKLYVKYKDEHAVAKERGLTLMTVQDHIVQAYHSGFDFGDLQLITEEHEKLIKNEIEKVGTGSSCAMKIHT